MIEVICSVIISLVLILGFLDAYFYGLAVSKAGKALHNYFPLSGFYEYYKQCKKTITKF